MHDPPLEERPPLLVLGLGNRLLRDDGVGLALLRMLRDDLADEPDVELVDGGTLGTALLGWISRRPAVLLLDAVDLGVEPGEAIVSMDPQKLASQRGASAHEGTAGELLATAHLLGEVPRRLALVGVQVDQVSTGLGLSPTVREGLPVARALALRLARELLAEVRQSRLHACTS